MLGNNIQLGPFLDICRGGENFRKGRIWTLDFLFCCCDLKGDLNEAVYRLERNNNNNNSKKTRTATTITTTTTAGATTTTTTPWFPHKAIGQMSFDQTAQCLKISPWESKISFYCFFQLKIASSTENEWEPEFISAIKWTESSARWFFLRTNMKD